MYDVSFSTLKKYASQINGLTIGQLAKASNTTLPKQLKNAKGCIGKLVELILGANAGNQSIPDFPELGIELKTLPLKANGMAKETTYICTAPFYCETLDFYKSRVYKKIQHIFWVTFEGEKSIPLAQKRIIEPFFWRPSQEEFLIIKQDWEELTEILHTGQIEFLSSHIGQYLQLRPKAAHSRQLIQTIDGKQVPKGFYLKCQFTNKMLKKNQTKHQRFV